MQMAFGERLRKVRVEKGFSVEEMENFSGISGALLQKVENGEKKLRFSYPVIVMIAEVLDVDIDELIDIQIV